MGDQLDASAGRAQVVRTSVLQATTHAAARARLVSSPRGTLRTSRAWALNENGTPSTAAARSRESGRRVGEVGVDRAYASAAHALDHMRHLRAWSRI